MYKIWILICIFMIAESQATIYFEKKYILLIIVSNEQNKSSGVFGAQKNNK